MLTPANFGLLSSVYTSLTGTGLMPGQLQQVQNSPNIKMLVQASSAGTIAASAACRFTSGYASTYLVSETGAAADYVEGVNDNAGAAIPAGSYFWLSVGGFVSVLAADGTAIGEILASSATAGTLGPSTTTTASPQVQANIVAQAANSSGNPAVTLAYLH
jgi:hypothetical protein